MHRVTSIFLFLIITVLGVVFPTSVVNKSDSLNKELIDTTKVTTTQELREQVSNSNQELYVVIPKEQYKELSGNEPKSRDLCRHDIQYYKEYK